MEYCDAYKANVAGFCKLICNQIFLQFNFSKILLWIVLPQHKNFLNDTIYSFLRLFLCTFKVFWCQLFITLRWSRSFSQEMSLILITFWSINAQKMSRWAACLWPQIVTDWFDRCDWLVWYIWLVDFGCCEYLALVSVAVYFWLVWLIFWLL